MIATGGDVNDSTTVSGPWRVLDGYSDHCW